MANGFDTAEIEAYMRDLSDFGRNVPKQTKKFLKKEATKLSKEQKNEIKSIGVGQQGITEREILARGKSGKVYKYGGAFSCRAFNGHPLAHLLDQGYLHRGGKNHDGAETFVPGYNFIEKAERQFQAGYFRSIDEFIDDMVDEI